MGIMDNLDKLSRNSLLDILSYEYGYIREYIENLSTDMLYFLVDYLDRLEIEGENCNE